MEDRNTELENIPDMENSGKAAPEEESLIGETSDMEAPAEKDPDIDITDIEIEYKKQRIRDKELRQVQYRARRKRVLMTRVGAALAFLVLILVIIFKTTTTYRGFVLDPTEFMSVRYRGFDGAAQATLVLDQEKLMPLLDRAYANYEKAVWPVSKDVGIETFRGFAGTIEGSLDKDTELSNGDELNISVTCDEEMAKQLKLSLKYEDIPFTVSNLGAGTVITREDVFRDLTISVNGISPVISLTLSNDSADAFLGSLYYRIENEKDFYEKGENIKIIAEYDEDKALSEGFDIEEGAAELTYTVPGSVRYVQSGEDIDEDTLREAIELGKDCFVGANEYGLRIFTEAHLPYTWVGTQDYTFEWSNPRILSAYVETVKDEYKGSTSKLYNYLELAYEVHISQANGVGCDAEAVVCFDQMTVDDSGKVDLNPESAQLFTASYRDSEIKKTIRGWFGDEYELNRLELPGAED